jgi:hypothetical protein
MAMPRVATTGQWDADDGKRLATPLDAVGDDLPQTPPCPIGIPLLPAW